MKEKISIKLKENTTLVGDFYNHKSNKGIILFPGFTEHRSSLDELAKNLNTHFKTWTFDINSQGESTGNWNLNEMEESAQLLITYLKQEHDLTKIGCFGNSLSGTFLGVLASKPASNIDCLCITSTPAGLQDVIPPYLLTLVSQIPQSAIRQGTILFDKIMKKTNENYKQKTHPQFKQQGIYQEHAQFGALKIQNARKLIREFKEAPQLEDYAQNINIPCLLVYGGEDKAVSKIKNSELPQKIRKMYNSIKSKDKELLIIPGADHSLNTTTKIDDSFNQDQKYSYVRHQIKKYFLTHL